MLQKININDVKTGFSIIDVVHQHVSDFEAAMATPDEKRHHIITLMQNKIHLLLL